MPIHPVPTHRDESEFETDPEYDTSNLDEGDEGEDESGEEEPQAAAPVQEPTPAETMPKRRGRKRKPQEQKPIGVGATIVAPNLYWKNRNLEVLWPEVLEYLQQQHRSPWEVDVRVKRTEPVEMLIGLPFSGGTVSGGDGRAASTAIVDKITDEYHLISGAMGPANYKVEIFWRVNSKVLTWATLRLNSPDAILAMRRQQQHPPQDPTMGYPARSFYQPQSSPQYPPPPPPYYGPPPGYGAPPPVSMAHGSNEEMRAELGYLRGTLDEVLRAQREGRQPNIQPPPAAGMGAPGGVDVEAIAQRVAAILRPSGLGATPVATPTVMPPTQAAAGLESSVQSLIQTLLQGTVKKVATNIDQAIRGEGQPAEAMAEVVEDDPKEDLPFSLIAVGSKWPDGRDVYFPKKKSDGTIDYMGVLAGNPFLMEKMADSVSGVVGSVGDLIKNLGRTTVPGAAEVVHNIPRGAVHAGMGQPQAQPPMQSPPPAPTVTNGAPPQNGGWPTG